MVVVAVVVVLLGVGGAGRSAAGKLYTFGRFVWAHAALRKRFFAKTFQNKHTCSPLWSSKILKENNHGKQYVTAFLKKKKTTTWSLKMCGCSFPQKLGVIMYHIVSSMCFDSLSSAASCTLFLSK